MVHTPEESDGKDPPKGTLDEEGQQFGFVDSKVVRHGGWLQAWEPEFLKVFNVKQAITYQVPILSCSIGDLKPGQILYYTERIRAASSLLRTEY